MTLSPNMGLLATTTYYYYYCCCIDYHYNAMASLYHTITMLTDIVLTTHSVLPYYQCSYYC